MLNKIAKWSLYLLSLALIINSLSHSFDGDLGWHLRFGKEITRGAFPYTDTYTWTFSGHNWTNHEWGGDIIFWSLYNNFGYGALIILTGLAIWLALILNIKNFSNKSQTTGAAVTVILALALNFILTVRLAMLSTLFFVLIILTLEKIEKKAYWYWPIIFWFWAAIHGSWILGFITIGIYLFSYLLTKIIPPKYSFLVGKKMLWDSATGWKVFIAAIISAITITLNPYGIKLWTEIFRYFSEGYFKQYVTEWLPSYTYPIFPWPLILGAAALVFIIWGHLKKKVTLAQSLLFLAVFYAAIAHKRNNLYLLILLAPILTSTLILAIEQIKWRWPNREIFTNIFNRIIITAAAIIIISQIKNVDWTSNPFDNTPLLARYGFPQTAVNFLKQDNKKENAKIFNEFWWGGYLNWTMPETKVFLDGRGTATWRLNNQETLLGAYRRIKFEAGGLEELEKNQVEYIVLNRNFSGYALPNKFNDWLFNEDLKKIFSLPVPHLVAKLNRSHSWQLIYQDNVTLIWKNLTVR